MFRKERGVTLVALVITIIVLLILAGVTITMALDENGIIAQAKNADEGQEEGIVRDLATSAMAAAYVRATADKLESTETDVQDAFLSELNNMDAFKVSGTGTAAEASDTTVTVTYNGTQYTITHTASSVTNVTGPAE